MQEQSSPDGWIWWRLRVEASMNQRDLLLEFDRTGMLASCLEAKMGGYLLQICVRAQIKRAFAQKSALARPMS